MPERWCLARLWFGSSSMAREGSQSSRQRNRFRKICTVGEGVWRSFWRVCRFKKIEIGECLILILSVDFNYRGGRNSLQLRICSMQQRRLETD